MGIGIGTALLVSSAVSVGSSIYAANKQEDAQQAAEAENRRMQMEAQANEQRIFEDTKGQSESATISFGSQDDDEMGSYNDFLTPLSTKTASTTGLSTGTSSGLGFGV